MTDHKILTQADIDKMIKEVEEQVANEPVYVKPIKENKEFEPIGYSETDGVITAKVTEFK